jgi:hypothetical protein
MCNQVIYIHIYSFLIKSPCLYINIGKDIGFDLNVSDSDAGVRELCVYQYHTEEFIDDFLTSTALLPSSYSYSSSTSSSSSSYTSSIANSSPLPSSSSASSTRTIHNPHSNLQNSSNPHPHPSQTNPHPNPHHKTEGLNLRAPNPHPNPIEEEYIKAATARVRAWLPTAIDKGM